ncbi:hypothetical protein SAMN04488062_104279 [Flavobacterium omnivorum]|uniref:Uncharacterized protein n=1 Tax=Flavobacterium omnivorum TaxID=178355 RepID=A0A1G8A102_9FLAO|nr:hypothetical protein SAMN04488062_104279 [Flavobacterium omnivorum]
MKTGEFTVLYLRGIKKIRLQRTPLFLIEFFVIFTGAFTNYFMQDLNKLIVTI